jgi:hypothetical protein
MEKRKSKTAGAILAAATIAGDVPLSEPRKPKVTYEWNPGDLIENLDHLALAKAERLRMQRAVKRCNLLPGHPTRTKLAATNAAITAWDQAWWERMRDRKAEERRLADEAKKEDSHV